MKVVSIQNYNRINKTNFSFKSDETQSSNGEQDTYIKRFVKDSFERRKTDIVNNAANNIVNNFKNNMISQIYSTPRLTTSDKQIHVLDAIADAYIMDCQFDKAAAITLHTMNKIYKDKSITDNVKKQKILSDNHIYVLKRFLYTTKLDNPILDNVVDTICQTNYKEFLSMAEYLLDTKRSDISLENNNKLRKYINCHYDLDVLSSFTDKSDYYKKGMCTVLSEWGLPKHIKYLTSVLNSPSKDKELKQLAITAIGRIGGKDSSNILKQYASNYSSSGDSAKLRQTAILYLDPKAISPDSHNFLRNLLMNQKSIKDGFGMGGLSFGKIVEALSKYNSADDVLLIEKYLYCGEVLRTYYALNAIGEIKSNKSKQTLFSYLNSEPRNSYLIVKNGETCLYKELAEAFTKQDLSKAEAAKVKDTLTELLNNTRGMNDEMREKVKSYFKFLGKNSEDVSVPKYGSDIWQKIYKKEQIEGYDENLIMAKLEKYSSYNDVDYFLNHDINCNQLYYNPKTSLIPGLIARIGKDSDINTYVEKNKPKYFMDDKIFNIIRASDTFISYNSKLLDAGKKEYPREVAKYAGHTADEANLFREGYSCEYQTFAKIFVRGNVQWK